MVNKGKGKLQKVPDWRGRREEYLRESGRTSDLIREGFRAKLKLILPAGYKNA